MPWEARVETSPAEREEKKGHRHPDEDGARRRRSNRECLTKTSVHERSASDESTEVGGLRGWGKRGLCRRERHGGGERTTSPVSTDSTTGPSSTPMSFFLPRSPLHGTVEAAVTDSQHPLSGRPRCADLPRGGWPRSAGGQTPRRPTADESVDPDAANVGSMVCDGRCGGSASSGGEGACRWVADGSTSRVNRCSALSALDTPHPALRSSRVKLSEGATFFS